MNNIEYLKEKLHKNPNILKKVISFEDILDVQICQIKHFLKLYDIKQNKYKYINLSLHDYKSFKLLYKTLITITNDDEEYKEISFSDLSIIEKESFLLEFNIKYEYVDSFLVAYPKNFKETKLIGSPSWCISKSESQWNNYNKNNSQCILFKGDEVIGVSYNDSGYDSFNSYNNRVKLSNSIYDCVVLHLGIINQEKNKTINKLGVFVLMTICLYIVLLIPVVNIFCICVLILFLFAFIFVPAEPLINNLGETLYMLSAFFISLVLALTLTPFAKPKDIIYDISIPYTEINIKFYDPIYHFPSDEFLSDTSLKSSFVLDDISKLEKVMIKYNYPILIGRNSIRFITNHQSYKVLSYIISNPEKFDFNNSILIRVIESANDISAFNFLLESENIHIFNLQKYNFDKLLSHNDNVILSKVLSLNDGISMISSDAMDTAFYNNNIAGALMLIDHGHLNHTSNKQSHSYFSELLKAGLKSKNNKVIDSIHLKMKELKFKPTNDVLVKAIIHKNKAFINDLDLSTYTLDSDYKILLGNLNQEINKD